MTGYPSRQDSAILPDLDYRQCSTGKNLFLIPYRKSFIDQGCSVKIAGRWPYSLLACFNDPEYSRTLTLSWFINLGKNLVIADLTLDQ